MTQWLEHWFLAEDLGLIPSTRTLAQTLTPMLGDLITPLWLPRESGNARGTLRYVGKTIYMKYNE